MNLEAKINNLEINYRVGKKHKTEKLIAQYVPIDLLEFTGPKQEVIYHPIIKDIEDNNLNWPILIKDNKVLVGNFRVYKAKELGYTHVSAMRIHSEDAVPLILKMFGNIDGKRGKSSQSGAVMEA